jgi:hypothetical protein
VALPNPAAASNPDEKNETNGRERKGRFGIEKDALL